MLFKVSTWFLPSRWLKVEVCQDNFVVQFCFMFKSYKWYATNVCEVSLLDTARFNKKIVILCYYEVWTGLFLQTCGAIHQLRDCMLPNPQYTVLCSRLGRKRGTSLFCIYLQPWRLRRNCDLSVPRFPLWCHGGGNALFEFVHYIHHT